MHTLTFKAPDELLAKLDKFAAQEERSKSYIIRKAVEAYLLEMEEDDADYKLAMERVNDPKAEYIPWEQVKAECGLEH